jgi:hypothetical protein
MISINLTQIDCKIQVAKIIRTKMEHHGITKSELILGTQLSKTAINSVLAIEDNEKDYRFGTLLKVLSYLKIKVYIGKNEDVRSNVLSLF